MRSMKIDATKCVTCVAIAKYVPAEGKCTENDAVHKAFTVGLMIGVGIEGAGLTPTFCDMHYKAIESIGEEFTPKEVASAVLPSTKRSG